MNDCLAMAKAISVAALGYPAPNPRVGCVILQGGEAVGLGHHDYAGGPHAEVVALLQAGKKSRGATVYVTLEPCNHQGRTPPCTKALISAGVAEVVFAVADPTSAGGGAAALRAAGIAVRSGFMTREAEEAAEIWLFAQRFRRPFVAVKAAASLDGRLALPSGESKWITGPAARAEGRRLRAVYGAVLVGRRTVDLDDPSLTARLAGVVNAPLRVVLDPSGELSEHRKVFNRLAPTWHVVRKAVRDGQVEVPWQAGFDLNALLNKLTDVGCTSLLVEGGAAAISSFLRADLVERIHLFTAPKLLGAGPSWLSEFGVSDLQLAPRFELRTTCDYGGDLAAQYDRRIPPAAIDLPS